MTSFRTFREAARRTAARLAFVFLGAALGAPSLWAQDALDGRVVRSGAPGADVPVELHRVSRDARGVVARATTDAAGRFRVALPPPDTGAFTVYFATAEASGVRYFGPALHPGASPDGYTVEVFDTTSAAGVADSVRVSRRDVFLLPEMGGGWEVAELVRVRNPARRTVVADGGRPAVGLALPGGALAFEVGSTDPMRASPDSGSLVRMGDRVWLTEPLVPGERDFFFRYRLAPTTPRAQLPLGRATDTLNVYVRQPGPEVEVRGLGEGTPFSAEGESFLRYTGRNLRTGARVSLAWEGPERSPVDPRLVALAVLGAVLAAGTWLAARRRPSSG